MLKEVADSFAATTLPSNLLHVAIGVATAPIGLARLANRVDLT
jgi:hypothetical protein